MVNVNEALFTAAPRVQQAMTQNIAVTLNVVTRMRHHRNRRATLRQGKASPGLKKIISYVKINLPIINTFKTKLSIFDARYYG